MKNLNDWKISMFRQYLIKWQKVELAKIVIVLWMLGITVSFCWSVEKVSTIPPNQQHPPDELIDEYYDHLSSSSIAPFSVGENRQTQMLPSAQYVRLYNENFNSGNAVNWQTGGGTWNVNSGVFNGKGNGGDFSYHSYYDGQIFDNFFYLCNVRYQSGSGGGYGITFRSDYTSNNMYLLYVNANWFIRSWNLWKLVDNEAIDISDWHWSLNLNYRGNWDTIGVKAQDDQIEIFINGTSVGKYTDNSFRNGNIGLVVGGNTQAEFDDVSVYREEIIVDDHGNNVLEATQISKNSSINGNIEVAGDEDFFKFQAIAGLEYQLETRLNTLIDSFLYLYDQNGISLIVSDDDGGVGYASKITWNCTNSGVYYIKVKAYNSTQTGTYTLSLQESIFASPTEVNISFAISNDTVILSWTQPEVIPSYYQIEVYRNNELEWPFTLFGNRNQFTYKTLERTGQYKFRIRSTNRDRRMYSEWVESNVLRKGADALVFLVHGLDGHPRYENDQENTFNILPDLLEQDDTLPPLIAYSMPFNTGDGNDVRYYRGLIELELNNNHPEWNDIPSIYFVGHSYGSLMIRDFLNTFEKDARIKGAVYFASPHYGSALADWDHNLFVDITNPVERDLEEASELVVRLDGSGLQHLPANRVVSVIGYNSFLATNVNTDGAVKVCSANLAHFGAITRYLPYAHISLGFARGIVDVKSITHPSYEIVKSLILNQPIPQIAINDEDDEYRTDLIPQVVNEGGMILCIIDNNPTDNYIPSVVSSQMQRSMIPFRFNKNPHTGLYYNFDLSAGVHNIHVTYEDKNGIPVDQKFVGLFNISAASMHVETYHFEPN